MSNASSSSLSFLRAAVGCVLATACSQDFLLHEKGDILLADDTGGAFEDEAEAGFDTGSADDGSPDGSEDGSGDADTGGHTPGEAEVDPDPDMDLPDTDPGEDPAPEDDCTETSDLIYVLDKDTSALSLFDPSTLTLSQLGVLDCDTWSSPASMGVARDGVAYVRMSDKEVFEVDLATLDCTSTAYSDRSTGFGSFGMGFATESASTWRDQLFVANARQLGLLDPSTWQITTLGTLPSQAELTGTGAGELFGVLPLESPLTVVELDQSSGAVLSTISVGTTLNIANLDTFAFAAWDGEFYLFVRYYGMGNTTEVHRIERDGSITRVVSELGINVVGAGVSTCAPS